MIFKKRCGVCGKEQAPCKLWSKWFCEFHYGIVKELYKQIMNDILEEDRKEDFKLLAHSSNPEDLC